MKTNILKETLGNKHFFMTRFKPYFAVYLILKNSENQILMSKRANTGFMDGFYSLPSGHVDEGEPASAALVRESQEEINIIPQNFELVHTLHIYNEKPDNKTYIALFFETSDYTGEVKNLEPDKCSELAWFDLNNLPVNIVPDLKLVLQAISQNKIYSEAG